MKTELEKLIAGELLGVKQVRIQNENLQNIPEQVFDLADSLEILDLNSNNLSAISERIVELKKLKILFLSNNNFTNFPTILSQCHNLQMIGFKANDLKFIAENSFPKKIRWLILTDNKIKKLPNSIKNAIYLQKVMLAGNQLSTLPEQMNLCTNIELLRISANKFTEIPNWIFEMPKLAWMALGGNPCTETIKKTQNTPLLSWNNFEIKEKIGEGASGIIYKGFEKNTKKEIAIKIFKGNITSDGFPETEMQVCLMASEHPNLIKIIGIIENHPEKKQGFVMELLPKNYFNLGFAPNFDTCTRDVFDPLVKYSENEIIKIITIAAATCQHLHANAILHGDIYAHNILINKENQIYFSDFGASSMYKKTETEKMQKIEVRAWACLTEDLLQNCLDNPKKTKNLILLGNLIANCQNENVKLRPNFSQILQKLKEIK